MEDTNTHPCPAPEAPGAPIPGEPGSRRSRRRSAAGQDHQKAGGRTGVRAETALVGGQTPPQPGGRATPAPISLAHRLSRGQGPSAQGGKSIPC